MYKLAKSPFKYSNASTVQSTAEIIGSQRIPSSTVESCRTTSIKDAEPKKSAKKADSKPEKAKDSKKADKPAKKKK